MYSQSISFFLIKQNFKNIQEVVSQLKHIYEGGSDNMLTQAQ